MKSAGRLILSYFRRFSARNATASSISFVMHLISKMVNFLNVMSVVEGKRANAKYVAKRMASSNSWLTVLGHMCYVDYLPQE